MFDVVGLFRPSQAKYEQLGTSRMYGSVVYTHALFRSVFLLLLRVILLTHLKPREALWTQRLTSWSPSLHMMEKWNIWPIRRCTAYRFSFSRSIWFYKIPIWLESRLNSFQFNINSVLDISVKKTIFTWYNKKTWWCTANWTRYTLTWCIIHLFVRKKKVRI